MDRPERSNFIREPVPAHVDAIQSLKQRSHVAAISGADHRNAFIALAETSGKVSEGTK